MPPLCPLNRRRTSAIVASTPSSDRTHARRSPRRSRSSLERALELRVGQELVVPVQREPAERERLGCCDLLKREDQQDQDRRIEEEDDEEEERLSAPTRRSWTGRRPSVRCHLSRLEKAGEEPRSENARPRPAGRAPVTDPVCQSGKPVCEEVDDLVAVHVAARSTRPATA